VQLERRAVPLRAIRTVAVSRSALVDAQIDWHTRRVEIEWLGEASATPARPSIGTTFFLLTRLFHSRARES
jgi:hypothetical protein